jgi:hypothetical protein
MIEIAEARRFFSGPFFVYGKQCKEDDGGISRGKGY